MVSLKDFGPSVADRDSFSTEKDESELEDEEGCILYILPSAHLF